MATLKEISIRLKSVKSISKITASMKMVSAAKFARAEKLLKGSRSIGPTSIALVEKAGLEVNTDAKKQVKVLVSSDRGLCGAIHSGICRHVRASLAAQADDIETKLVLCGDKARGIMQRTHKDSFLVSMNNLGKKPPVFIEASFAAENLINSGYEWETGTVVFNWFKNAGTYICTERPLVNGVANIDSDALQVYDDVDEEALRCYSEFNLANNIFYCMIENASSEQSARMSAMENATNNANDMIDALAQKYNRTRQAVITTELCEIIAGASAM